MFLLITTGISPHTRIILHHPTGIMSTYGNTMDNILSSMPKCTIAPLQGPPDMEYLTELNTYLNLCSASVHSNFGCGTLVHLALASPTPPYYTLYFQLLRSLFPKNPGPIVTIPTPTPASAVIASLTR